MHPDLEEAIAFHEAIIAGRRQGPRRLRHREGARQRRAAVGNPDHLRQERTAAGQRRQPAAARRARRRQDVLRRHPRRHQRRQVRAHPGPRRPAADRSRRLPDDQPGHRRARSPSSGRWPSAEVILLDEINRIPLKSQSAFLEGAAGPHRHRRQDDLRAAGVQLRDRDDEPGGARAGHVPAVGSGDRSLRDHGQHRLPAARGRSRSWSTSTSSRSG